MPNIASRDGEALLSERDHLEFELDGDEDVLFTDEDEGLMLGRSKKEIDLMRRPSCMTRWLGTPEKRVAVMATVLMLLSIAIVGVLIVVTKKSTSDANAAIRPRNVIFMISDGYGPAAQTLARTFVSGGIVQPHDEKTAMDSYLVGTSRSRSSSSFITDSAAGATAFSCGIKSHNRGIGVDANDSPCGTILEAAKAAGYGTGVVVTSYLADATPASYAAHVADRSSKGTIAKQMMTLGIDVMMGGGLGYFVPKEDPRSLRTDSTDLLGVARNASYSVITDADQLQQLSSLPVLGLFSREYMDLVIDRNHLGNDATSPSPRQPSLWEMVDASLRLLTTATARSEKGFFLLVEGSQIDIAGHMNDAAALARETVEYNDMFSHVIRYADGRGDTLIVSTSDHETGGLTLGYQYNDGGIPHNYEWDVEPLRRANRSTYAVAMELFTAARASILTETFVREHCLSGLLGISDATAAEVSTIVQLATTESVELSSPSTVQFSRLAFQLGRLVNSRCGIGFTTQGHTAVDVNIYAHGPSSSKFVGNWDNTDVGLHMWDIMQLDRTATTASIKRKFGDNVTRRSGSDATENRDLFHDAL
eukprot:Opistho-2@80746